MHYEWTPGARTGYAPGASRQRAHAQWAHLVEGGTNMRRRTTFVAALLAVSLAGCGTNANSPSPVATPSPAATVGPSRH